MSWLPLIKDGHQQGRHDYAFSEYHGNFFKQDWYMLVKDGYKFTYYVNDRPSLFNLEEDPQEMADLAEEESYRELLQQFEVLLRDCRSGSGFAKSEARSGPNRQQWRGLYANVDGPCVQGMD